LKSIKVWLPFVQSDVYCTLYICSGVGKDYRGEDQVLEIDRKVGEHFWSVLEGEKLAKLTRKIKYKKTIQNKTNKQTNKKTSNLLVA
jgi:hypothetical protein